MNETRRGTGARGQATTELALGSLVLVSIIMLGIYFGEVTFAQLKVQEATNSAVFDLTHYKHHSMVPAYSTNPIDNARASAEGRNSLAYQNFDGRSSQIGVRPSNLTQVMTRTTGMQVRCTRGGGPGFLPNPLVMAAYNDNSGVSCWSQADVITGPNMPRQILDQSSSGFFQRQHWTRATLRSCGVGRAVGGACNGRATIMLDDWGLTGPGGGEWLPAPGLPFGFPSVTNPSYWFTAYRGYLTSYWLNAAFKPVMWSLPASVLATFMAHGIHPMGFILSFNFGGMPWNESTFYLSFNSSLTAFQNIGVMPSEGGILGSVWETTPFVGAIPMITYFTAWNTRRGNGGCYLGLPC